ncbi:hypothetical protein [Streptomyces albireticuli]|uniref:hypothetical protein n=1 Tax=Streptomyces albireticuli TaxID=1940 RepID=UPI0036A8567F
MNNSAATAIAAEHTLARGRTEGTTGACTASDAGCELSITMPHRGRNCPFGPPLNDSREALNGALIGIDVALISHGSEPGRILDVEKVRLLPEQFT